jgi:exodeoxyribonuclease-3
MRLATWNVNSIGARLPRLLPWLEEVQPDVVALHDEDVWDISAFAGSTHVTAPERAAVRRLLDWGLTDVQARPGKGDRAFTYWDYRAGMMHKNLGMRIDYVLASAPVAAAVTDAYVDREARKGKGASDHAPVVVDVDL